MKATRLNDLSKDFLGEAISFKLEPGIEVESYDWSDEERDYVQNTRIVETVVVSAIISAFDTLRPETYIFPSDTMGTKAISWLELKGSQRGICDIEKCLTDLGYKIAKA